MLTLSKVKIYPLYSTLHCLHISMISGPKTCSTFDSLRQVLRLQFRSGLPGDGPGGWLAAGTAMRYFLRRHDFEKLEIRWKLQLHFGNQKP